MVDSPFDINDSEETSNQEKEEHDQPYPRSVIVGVVVLCALIGVLVFWQMKFNLALEIPLFGEGELAFKSVDQGVLDVSDDLLKIQDSDEDGLSDFEELRIFGSSPFIADSDSDGISDFDEIQQGTDPNCPEGQNCFGAPVQNEEEVAVESPLNSEQLQEILSDPVKIRQLLIQQGAQPEMVNSLDDQTLQLIAQEAMTSLTTPSAENFDQLAQITPQQLREVLQQSGVSAEELSQLTDEQLQALYLQVLDQARQQFSQTSQ